MRSRSMLARAVPAIALLGLAACTQDEPTAVSSSRPLDNTDMNSIVVGAGTPFAQGVTSPTGVLQLGTTFWVADHLLGFCRLDQLDADAPLEANQLRCASGPVSAGQPSFDGTKVYVPDNARSGGGSTQVVHRFTWNPGVNGGTLSPNGTISIDPVADRQQPNATAIDPATGALYVGSIRNGNIQRVSNPGTATSGTVIGTTFFGGGVSSLTVLNGDLYIAEDAAGVSKIANVASCAGSCVAELVTELAGAGSPTALAADDAADKLYVANSNLEGGNGASSVFRLTLPGTCHVFVTGPTFASGLGVDGAGDLYIADDPGLPTEGVLQGRVFKVLSNASPEAGTCDAPALPSATHTAGAPVAHELTSPGGIIRLGPATNASLWVSDHLLGFCRLDQLDADPQLEVNQTTCNTAATSPGQASYDPGRNNVYVPDNASASQGVWKLRYNPTTKTVSTLLVAGNPITGGGLLPGNRATATAIRVPATGAVHLFVGTIRDPNILRINNPHLPNGVVRILGQTASGGGVSALALADPSNALYIAEETGVTRLTNAVGNCGSNNCRVNSGALFSSATVPVALAATPNGNQLYIGETLSEVTGTSMVWKYTIGTNTSTVHVHTGDGGASPFKFVSALTVLTGGGTFQNGLYIADDPGTFDELIFFGRAWRVPQ